MVDADVVGKVKTLSTVIDEKTGEKFEFKISDADGKEIGSLMKGMSKGTHNLFDQFAYTDDKGVKQYNHQEVFKMQAFYKNRETIIKSAYNDRKAAGAKAQINDLKNTNMTPASSKPITNEPKNEQEAQKKAMQEKFAKEGSI